MDFFNKLLKFNDLSDVGSWASIVGLAVSAITVIMLIGIKRRFIFRSSVESHQKKLGVQANELSASLSDFSKNKTDIDELLALVDVELRMIQRGAKDDLARDVKKARSQIKSYSSKSIISNECANKTEANAREIKTLLTVIVAQFEHVKKDLMVGAN